MVGVVNFLHQIGDGQLQLQRPEPIGFAARHQPQARPEIVQDQRGLRDHQLAGLEKRRRIGRTLDPRAIHELRHRVPAVAAAARHVDVVGAALLQRQADELAAALDFRPVVKLVAHGFPPVR